MSKTITALIDTHAEADTVITQLDQEGFSTSQVSLLMSEESRGRHFSFIEDDKSDEGAVTGAAIGGLAGALYLGLATAGTFVIPGLNIVASGALIGALAGLGAGGGIGGFIGALVGAGIPEHEARLYEEKLSGDHILIAVRTDNNFEETRVQEILKTAKAHKIKRIAA